MGLVVGIWVARYLGPQQYGLLNFATAMVELFTIFVTLGMQSIIVRDLVNTPEGAGATIGTAMAMQLLGALVAYMLLSVVVSCLRPEDALARTVVLLMGLILFLQAFNTVKYWFEAKVMSKYLVWLSNTVFLALSGLKVVMILTAAPLLSFVWVTVADAVIVGLGSVVLFLKIGLGWGALRVDFTRAKQLLSDSWPLFLAGAAVAVYMKIDMVMLAQMAGDEAAGIYAAATKVSELWYFIPAIIVASVFPSILNAKKHDEMLYYRRLQQLFDLMVWLSVAVALPMTFLSGPIITMLFSAAYAEAGAVLAVHIWAAVFVFLGLASGKWFIAEGHQLLSLQRTLAGALINIGLNVVLIPQYGALGAAWSTVIAYGFAAFLWDLTQNATRTLFVMKLAALNPFAASRRLRELVR
jgi:PST family polysaccharide transporter